MATFTDRFTVPFTVPGREGSRQEHGAGNREHGAGVVGPKVPSIVTVVTRARSATTVAVDAGRDRVEWMAAPRQMTGWSL